MSQASAPRRSAFTLIELLVVVAIIALLLSILLPSLRNAREQGKVAKCLANLKNLQHATRIYFAENDDTYPFYVYRGGRWLGVSSSSYGGKTSHEYWKHKYGGVFYQTADEKAMNPILINGRVSPNDEFPMLRCPSDIVSYSRIYLEEDQFEPAPISSYDDRGTSYGFNLHGLHEMLPSEWGDPHPNNGMTGENWAYYLRLLLRQDWGEFQSRYVMYMEGPAGFCFRDNIQVVGNHLEFSRHCVGFLDGHAEYLYMDTRNWCGPGWYVINPVWVAQPPDYKPVPRYNPRSGKTCEY